MRIRKIYILLMAFSLLMLFGCSKKEDGAQNQSATDAEQRGYSFIFVCPIMENEYWADCMDGIKKADEKLGTTTKVIGPKYADNFAEEIVGYMEQAVEEKPDGIILYAGIDSLAPLIDKAADAGIPVMALDSDAPATKRVAYVGTDGYNLGYNAGETLVKLADGKAKVGILVSSKSAEKENEVVNAFIDAVEDYDIEILDVKETSADPAVAEQKTRELLKEHPEMTAMFNTAGYNVTGAARVKKALSKNNLILLGLDDTEENLKYLNEGVIDGLFVQRIREAGYQSVYLLKEYVDRGYLSKTSYDSGTVLVTKDNIDSYNDDAGNFENGTKSVKLGYYSGDTAFQNGCDDGARKSGYAYEYYQAIAYAAGWDYEYVYGSRAEVMAMLEKGEVDIVAGIYNTDALKDKVLFSNLDMGLEGEKRYFAINRQRADLLDDINGAMRHLSQYSPDFISLLNQKYYSKVTEQILSDEEFMWLSEKVKLKIGYVKNCLPLSDGDDNEAEGVVGELIENISSFVCVDIESVCYKNLAEMEQGLRNHEIDIAFPIYSDLWLNEENGIMQTEAIVKDRAMIVYSGGYSSDLMDEVALTNEDIGMKYYLESEYPEVKTVIYESCTDALDAVLKGDVKCIAGWSSVMQRVLRRYSKYKEMNVAYLDSSGDFVMGVNENDNILLSILNKTIRQIDEAAINSAMVKFSGVDKTYSFKDILQMYAFNFSIILMFIVAVLLVVFVSYLRKNSRFKREQAAAHVALTEALEKANTANDAKTNFLSSISHDIRTPMNAIAGMTAIANMHLDDRDRVEDCLKKIELSSHHLITLINNVLDLSKIESSKLQLNPLPFSLRNTVDEMLVIIQPQIKAKDIEFTADTEGLVRENVVADEVRINQVFINILTNAVKYTEAGGRISLKLTEELSEDDNNVKVIYSVEDNGMGMSEEFMKNMYDNFARAKDSRINKIQGAGLGLAIVKQIVDMMDGVIECESEEGKGTKFIVTLELPVAPDYEEVPDLIHDDDKKESSFMEGKKILVVEDNDLNWEVISGILEMFGVITERAENGQICIDMLKSSEPYTYDLILMDIQMPVMNGRDATVLIRKDEDDYIRNIPVIAMTADAFAEDVEASLNAGMNGHVSKPVDTGKLFQEFKKVLK